MPLESREDYERLNAHLDGIDAPLETFALRYGYQITPRLRAGLYPRINLRHTSAITRFIEITMDCDSTGERFDHFYPEIPYTVWGTAWVNDESHHIRWRSPDIRLEGIPTCSLPLYRLTSNTSNVT